jgi:hypothetical protein
LIVVIFPSIYFFSSKKLTQQTAPDLDDVVCDNTISITTKELPPKAPLTQTNKTVKTAIKYMAREKQKIHREFLTKYFYTDTFGKTSLGRREKWPQNLRFTKIKKANSGSGWSLPTGRLSLQVKDTNLKHPV